MKLALTTLTACVLTLSTTEAKVERTLADESYEKMYTKKGKTKKSKMKKAKKGKKSKYVDNGLSVRKPVDATNICAGAKVDLPNGPCEEVFSPQAGADVTVGYTGDMEVEGYDPVIDAYWMTDMCPVNVHWHLGTEHRSEGEYDETVSSGPEGGDGYRARALAAGARLGHRCGYYDETKDMFTKPYDWKYCVDMEVGETYEVHWPHSHMGACGTINQYQTPFYDGVFCHVDRLDLGVLPQQVGVQAQIFTIVNDEDYYFPDMMRGMLVDEELGMGVEVTKYLGSTTGTSRDADTICSSYSPITWQVDRKCHMVSASSFDKMCADMLMQRDDMSDDLYPHGAREVVVSEYVHNGHVYDRD